MGDSCDGAGSANPHKACWPTYVFEDMDDLAWRRVSTTEMDMDQSKVAQEAWASADLAGQEDTGHAHVPGTVGEEALGVMTRMTWFMRKHMRWKKKYASST